MMALCNEMDEILVKCLGKVSMGYQPQEADDDHFLEILIQLLFAFKSS